MDLEAQLIERAVEERREILQKAKARAASILQKAENEVERIRRNTERQVVSIVGSELRAVRDRLVGQAELEGRKALMNARKNLMDSVFGGARKKLEEISKGETETDYHRVLENLISEAIKAIGGESFVVWANKADLAYLSENLEKMDFGTSGLEIELGEKPVDVIGGVIVENLEGTKIYRNTLGGRLMKVRQDSEAEIAKKLGVI